MADKQVAVRLVVQGGDKAKADFRGVGAAGDQAMQQLGRSAKAGGGALRASAADMDEMGRGGRQLGMQMQNASYQVGDFFVQIASGTDGMRAAAQQLPQLLGGFGVWGAVAGAAVAAGGALIPMFMGSAEASDTFENSLSDLNEMMRQHRDLTEAASIPMAELLDKFGENAVAARDLFETLALIERIKLANKLDELKSGLGGAPSDIGALVQEYSDAAAMTDGGGQQVALQAQEALRESYGLTVQQAKEVKTAMDQLASAEGPEQVAQAAQALAVALLEARSEGARIPPEMLAAADQAASLAQSGYELATVMGEAEGAISGAGGAIDSATAATDGWAASMSSVRAEIGAIASALASMGSGAIANASKYVELNALQQGRSISEAARARREAEMAAEFAAREASAGNWAERMLVRGERALAEQGLEIDAQLEAARADAREAARASGGGRRGRAGGRGGSDGFASAMDRTGEQIDRLKAEAAAFAEAAAAGSDYGNAVEFAKKKAELLAAAQKQGIAITPELTAKIEAQAQAYVTAAEATEEAKRSAEELARTSERGRDALAIVFGAVVDGSDAAKQAVVDLLKEIARIQLQKSAMGLIDGVGGGGIFDFLGGLLSGARANGGGVKAGGAYLVNENTARSEVFVPSQNGAILNVAQAQAALRSQVSPAAAGTSGVIRVELSQQLVGQVLQQAGAQALQLVSAADKRLPERLKEINGNPRKR